MKILMCKPTYYDVVYEINPWMKKNCGVSQTVALRQWETLHSTLQQSGVTVELIQPVTGWPDMVFTANAGLLLQNKIWISQFKYPERQGERPYFEKWFQQAGYLLASSAPQTQKLSFEGEGDALFAGEILFAGYGFRSDKNYYQQFIDSGIECVLCELVDPYFYHLDTCFCPLNAKQALWWPEAFSAETQQRLQQHLQLITVPAAEAQHFACNSIVLGQQIVIPKECPETEKILQKLGFVVSSCAMSEFIKAGGACKCLTLWLDKK